MPGTLKRALPIENDPQSSAPVSLAIRFHLIHLRSDRVPNLGPYSRSRFAEGYKEERETVEKLLVDSSIILEFSKSRCSQ